MTIIDRDLGWERIKDDVRRLDKSFTKVGLPENGTVESGTRVGSGGKLINDMSELVQVGAINEFGGKNPKLHPERSWLRSTSDEQRQSIARLQEKMYEGVLTGVIPLRKALAILGEFLTGKVKRKIQTLKLPANKLSTVRKKKSTNPLIDKGQLVQSIQHEEVIP